MREVTLSDGRKVEVRPMTRKEIRGGKQYGYGSISYRLVPEKSDEAVDYPLFLQLKEEVFDDLPNPDLLKIHLAIMTETYSLPGEEKNSSTSGPGAQTHPESESAGSVDDGKQ